MRLSGSITPDGQESGGVPRNRMGNFLLSLGIMMFSFFLYDLGLFGGVEGPLNPAKIGTTLAAIGLKRTHLVGLTAALAFVALTWHWMLNTVNGQIGARLTCSTRGKDGKSCAAPVTREYLGSEKTGKSRFQYICAAGHKSEKADFRKAVRGPIGNSVGIFSLVICLVLLFS